MNKFFTREWFWSFAKDWTAFFFFSFLFSYSSCSVRISSMNDVIHREMIEKKISSWIAMTIVRYSIRHRLNSSSVIILNFFPLFFLTIRGWFKCIKNNWWDWAFRFKVSFKLIIFLTALWMKNKNSHAIGVD